MIVSEIKLYELLKAKIGEKEAEAFVEILEKRVDRKFEETKSTLATKEDLAQQETRLTRSIYMAGLIQYPAMLASLIAIIKFLM
jgi:hypothetical protein